MASGSSDIRGRCRRPRRARAGAPPGSAALTQYSAPLLGNYLGGLPPQLAPFGFGASLLAHGDFTFRTLTTCSWEQSDTMVKVYVPLRGVQTELLRSSFTMSSLEARIGQGRVHGVG